MTLTIRPARASDCRLYYDWSMEDDTRVNSVRHQRFELDAHGTWFQARLHDPRSCMWVLEVAGEPAGQVRYGAVVTTIDKAESGTPGEAEVAISIAKEHRGRGLSTYLLAHTENAARRALQVGTIVALILPHNVASVRAFERAGYIYAGAAARMNKFLLRYERPPCRYGGHHGPDLIPCVPECFGGVDLVGLRRLGGGST